MRHPFERWPRDGRRNWLVAGALVAGALWLALLVVNAAITTDSAPRGILSLQAASSSGEVIAMVEEWADEGSSHLVGFSLGLDLLFIPVFFSVVAGACAGAVLRARRAGRAGLASIGVWAAWAAWAAGAFDVVEDVSHLRLLDAAAPGVLVGPDVGAVDALLNVATGCVLAKYQLLAASLLYVVVALAVTALRPAAREPSAGAAVA